MKKKELKAELKKQKRITDEAVEKYSKVVDKYERLSDEYINLSEVKKQGKSLYKGCDPLEYSSDLVYKCFYFRGCKVYQIEKVRCKHPEKDFYTEAEFREYFSDFLN